MTLYVLFLCRCQTPYDLKLFLQFVQMFNCKHRTVLQRLFHHLDACLHLFDLIRHRILQFFFDVHRGRRLFPFRVRPAPVIIRDRVRHLK